MSTISCPVCQTPLQESVRENILIDTCPTCRGVWLDRGELEKLLHAMREEASITRQEPRFSTINTPPTNHKKAHSAYYKQTLPTNGHTNTHYYDEEEYNHNSRHQRKKSKLETLFDIFD